MSLVHSEEEALAFLESIRKKYWGPGITVMPNVIGEKRELVRCSDDGEPGGHSGRPIRKVRPERTSTTPTVVVTPVFRRDASGNRRSGAVPFQGSAGRSAVSTVIEKQYGVLLKIGTDYNGVGKIQYLLGQRGIPVIESEYTDKVTLKIRLTQKRTGVF